VRVVWPAMAGFGIAITAGVIWAFSWITLAVQLFLALVVCSMLWELGRRKII